MLPTLSGNSGRQNIFEILKTKGFKLKFYGKIYHKPGGRDKGGINNERSCVIENTPLSINGIELAIGDVAYTDGGNRKGHFCIWSGKAWVSDCWQATLAVHSDVIENIWIHSYNYNGNPINMTPNGNSVLEKPGYYPL